MEKKFKKKSEIAKDKHRASLAGTEFACCADCPGTLGKITAEGQMLCSNVNGIPVSVTASQAKACDGSKPLVCGENKKNYRPHPVFRRPEHHQ